MVPEYGFAKYTKLLMNPSLLIPHLDLLVSTFHTSAPSATSMFFKNFAVTVERPLLVPVIKFVRTIRSGDTKTAKPKPENRAIDTMIRNKRHGLLPPIRRLQDDMVDVTPFGKYEAM